MRSGRGARSATTPRTPLASLVPKLSPFSLLVIPSASPTIVGGLSRLPLPTHLIERPLVPAAYNFTQSGTGDYSIEPSNLFTYVDADGAPRELYAAVEGIAKVKLSGNLPLSQHIHNRRTGYTGCSAIQQAVINATAYAAQKIAAEAYAYIKNVSGPTPRYTTWFGAYDPARKARVQSVLKRISKNTQFPKLTYHCDCDKDAAGAYVRTYIFHRWTVT